MTFWNSTGTFNHLPHAMHNHNVGSGHHIRIHHKAYNDDMVHPMDPRHALPRRQKVWMVESFDLTFGMSVECRWLCWSLGLWEWFPTSIFGSPKFDLRKFAYLFRKLWSYTLLVNAILYSSTSCRRLWERSTIHIHCFYRMVIFRLV